MSGKTEYSPKMQALFERVAEFSDLEGIMALLGWDQQVYMPPGGAEERGLQSAALGRILHEKFATEEFGQLIADLEDEIGDLNAETDVARSVKVIKRNYEKQVKVPLPLLMESIKAQTMAHEAWVQAKARSDFSIFKPHLETIVDLRKQYVELFQPYDHIYDPLLDDFEPGMKTADVKEIFDKLRPQQVELLQAITEKELPDNSFIKQPYKEDYQDLFGRHVITCFGYDWQRGRMDVAPHPFTTGFGLGDVRITTRYLKDDVGSALFSTMHESGHAMYAQGVSEKYKRHPLGGAASLAIHESQSRLWENIIGRSKEFWTYFYPSFQMLFPEYLAEVSLADFYRGINRVEPSFIRVEADEATYNMHIMLRLEIEIGLMEGTINVGDLPEIWNNKMQDYLGITPPDDARGVLQDIHWSGGMIGYFPTYALGNLASVQLWEKLLQEHPNVPDEIAQAKFDTILAWMREHVHQYGAKYDPQEIMIKATGSKITPEPYMAYLRKKYAEIYDL
ncbi:MAG: carboxypeptidase M32 [Chloroflexi bacterium]|jgi:carboxypeptidase Taq|nr:carboxypeptidase M32 [Chloroflexota bacterium]